MSFLDSSAEYARPWKLSSFFCGVALLLVGARWSGLPDWDGGVSVLMAVPTYFTAAPSLRVVLERRWNQLPTALFWCWFCVDGTYALYWRFADPAALAFRPANAFASLSLYVACGLVWLHHGTLKQLIQIIGAASWPRRYGE